MSLFPLLDPWSSLSPQRIDELKDWCGELNTTQGWNPLPLKEHFDRIRQILEPGLTRLFPEESQVHEVRNQLHDALHSALDALYQMSHPDIPTLVSAYHALRQSNPHAGHPLYQYVYDEYFRTFNRVYEATPHDTEEWNLLSDIRSNYIKQLTGNLRSRDDETFRTESYHWLTLIHDGYTSPYITEAIVDEAETRIFSNYDKVKTCHHAPGWNIPDMEVTWLLNILIAMQLNPLHQYSMEPDCIAIAQENLDLLKNREDPSGRNTQLLALLHQRTGNPTYQHLADALISTWSNDTLTLEQRHFLQYYRA